VNPVVVVTPLLMLAMLAEHLLAKRQGRAVYSWSGVISDMTSAAGQHLLALPLGLSLIGLYQQVGVQALPLSADEPLHWLAGFVLMDLVWYFRHRAGHRIALFWAVHVVHHQSREMNLGVAQRLSWFQGLQTLPFTLLIAFLGVPVEMYAALYAAAHFYQFWMHSTLLGSMGILEWVLVTPTHHRVHHGCDAPYIDKNFGHTLIVWDRLLGTFAAESVPVTYGTTAPVTDLGAVSCNIGPLAALAGKAKAHGLRALLMPPGWRHDHPADLSTPQHPPASPARVVSFVAFFACALGLLAVAPGLPWPAAAAASVGLLLWAAGLGRSADQGVVAARHARVDRSAPVHG